MTDKEIIEGFKRELNVLGRIAHSDPRGPSEQQKERMELYRAAISRLQFYSALLQEVGLDIDAYLIDTIMGDKHSSVDWQKVFRKTSANLDAAFNQEEE